MNQHLKWVATLATALATVQGCSSEVDTSGAGAGSGSGGGTTAATSGQGGATSSSASSTATAATGTGGAGGAATGSGGGEGGASQGASEACQACVATLYSTDEDCAAAIQICDGDEACNDWKNCNEDCFNENDTSACYEACDDAFPHEADKSAPLLACTCGVCGELCEASCAGVPL